LTDNCFFNSKGSIIAQTELTFNTTKRESEVLDTISKATANNTLGSSLILAASQSGNVSIFAKFCKKMYSIGQ